MEAKSGLDTGFINTDYCELKDFLKNSTQKDQRGTICRETLNLMKILNYVISDIEALAIFENGLRSSVIHLSLSLLKEDVKFKLKVAKKLLTG